MSRKGELPLYKKFFICFIVVMTVFMTMGIGSVGSMSVYASTSSIVNPQLQQPDNVIIQMLSEEEEKLTSQGFKVILVEPDFEAIIKDAQQMRSEPKTEVSGFVKATVAATHIELDTEDYYFKNEIDASSLVEKINENELEYTEEQVKLNPKEITSLEVIENKKAQLDEHKKQVEEQKEKERKAREQVTSRNGSFRRQTETSSFPLESFVYISSSYGPRHGRTHTGVDFATSAGSNILAWKSGTVITAGWQGNYGNFIEIQHNDGTISRYAHLSGYACSRGQQVSQGQIIGYVGSTGNSTGPHLHFEIKVNGDFVNPVNYLNQI